MLRELMGTGLILTLFICVATANDWPQWTGPQRDSIWRETGIVESIPESGLKVLWRISIHGGYAGPAVVGDRVFVTDYVRTSGDTSNDPGTRNKLQGSERVLCLSAEDGAILWTHEYECPYAISYPAGPRATPVVDGERVYTLGAEGHLFCLNTSNGDIIWSKQLKEEYNTESPVWGFAGHPLIEGETLYCLVGGEGSVAVAFDKHTGAEKWKAVSASEPGYCPPTMMDQAGTRQLLIWDADKINSLNPQTGQLYWSVPLKPDYGMSIMAPRWEGNLLFLSGIRGVGAALKLNPDEPGAEVAWTGTSKTAVYCANSTPFIEDGIIYGVDCGTGGLRAVRLESGERLWEVFEPTTGDRRKGHGTAFLVKHQDKFFLFSETGDLISAQLSSEGYTETGRFHVLEPTGEAFGRSVVWSHPAFANQACYARNDKEIVCVSLKAE